MLKFTTTIPLLALAAATPAFAQSTDSANATKPGDEIIVTASRSGEGIRASELDKPGFGVELNRCHQYVT